jgi:LytS/YehU family sensor histidine kinase
MMRYMLYESNVDFIPLQKEIKIIEDYIALERLRYGNKLAIEFNIEGDIYQVKVAPLILLPFVENAFKHGVADSRHEAHIKINIKQEEHQLYFIVFNSLETSENNFNGGLGLQNVKRQLELIYPQNHKLHIVQSDVSYLVNLKINL